MRSAKKTSIKHKLYMSQIALTVVVLISFFAISTTYFIVKTIKTTKVNMQYSSDITVSNLLNYIDLMENYVHSASYSTDIATLLSDKNEQTIFDMQGNYTHVSQTLNMILMSCNIPVSFTLYPTRDDIVIYDNTKTAPISKIDTQAWFENLRINPNKFCYFTETEDNASYFCIVNTLYNPYNLSEPVGYLKISTEISNLIDILQDCVMENDDSILLNEKNEAVFSLSGKEYNEDSIHAFAGISPDDPSTIRLDKESFFASKSTQRGSRYSVIVLQSKDNIYKTVYTMCIILLGILLLISAASFIVAHRISGPIIKTLDELIMAMKMSDLGEFKTIETRENGSDELDEAVNTYNNMVNSITELVQYNNSYAETIKKHELSLLQMQIKPHFLYNTLDAIQHFAKENKPDDVVYLIRNLSKFYRISLHNKNDLVKLESEINHIKYYAAIENFKHNNAFTLKIDIAEEFMDYCIPKITLQPIVENAMYHGILEKENPVGTIELTARNDGDYLYLYVTDDGVGISEDKIKEIFSETAQSVGIVNTDSRLKLFLGSECGITFDSKENEYTRAIIKVKGVKLYDKDSDYR
ncbi:MAG: sensor histidine kinase [Monoglobaceae bacterium]